MGSLFRRNLGLGWTEDEIHDFVDGDVVRRNGWFAG